MKRMVYGDSDDAVWLDHDGVVKSTEKAVLYRIHDEQRWVPKSVIVDEGDEVLGVRRWWAEKNGLEGDW